MGRFTDWLFGTPEVRTQPAIQPPAYQADHVTTGDATSLSAVYRASQIIAVGIKQLSVKTYRGDEEVTAPNWVRRPNIKLSRSAFLEQTTYSLVLNGNAYWFVSRDNQSRVTNLEVLNPNDVQIESDDWGNVLSYSYKGSKYAPSEIQHLSIGRMPGHAKGQGPIQKAQTELRGAVDLQDYAGNWFKDAGVPTGILKSDQVLNAEQASAYKEQWTESQGAKRGVAVLGNGLSYQGVYLSPTEAQFIENQQFSVTQIARLFGIPARLMLAVVEGGATTYTNMESEEISFMRYTLANYVIEIEDALSLLLAGRTEAKFNIDALLRPDTLTRYQAHKLGIEAGFLTVDEVRAIENRAPIEKETNE